MDDHDHEEQDTALAAAADGDVALARRARRRPRRRAAVAAVMVLLALTALVGKWWMGPYWQLRSEVAGFGFGEQMKRVQTDVSVDPLSRVWSGSYLSWTYQVPDDMDLAELTAVVRDHAQRAGWTLDEPEDGFFNDGELPYRDFEVRSKDDDLGNVNVIALLGARPWTLQVSASD